MAPRRKNSLPLGYHPLGGTVLLVAIAIPFKLHASEEATTPDIVAIGDNTVEIVIRWGQGGFNDGRSPIGKLGGGQMTFDIKPVTSPIAISLSGEYYTNSPNATHAYEISALESINLLYMSPLLGNERVTYFFGGGFGKLEVPREGSDTQRVEGSLFNLEAGIRTRPFDHFGFYVMAKYLKAEKSEGDVKVIDFNEAIGMVGITYEFRL